MIGKKLKSLGAFACLYTAVYMFGSAIFGAADVEAYIAEMKACINKHLSLVSSNTPHLQFTTQFKSSNTSPFFVTPTTRSRTVSFRP